MSTRVRIGSAPTYRPGAEQFQEPIGYIESVRENARSDGICRILPPPEEWKVCSGTLYVIDQVNPGVHLHLCDPCLSTLRLCVV